MSYQALSIGINAMLNAQVALRVTGNNISNADTEGYSRQQVQMKTNDSMVLGYGKWIGTGASIDAVNRIHNDLYNTQVNITTSAVKKQEAYATSSANLETLLSDFESNISSAMANFYSAASAAASQPTSSSNREAMYTAASAIAERFQEMNLHIETINNSLNQEITADIKDINVWATEIARMNTLRTKNSPEINDEQELLAAKISEKIGTIVTRSGDGNLNVMLPNGQPLVQGGETYKLQAYRSQQDPTFLDIGAERGGGLVTSIGDKSVATGELGGMIAFRNEVLGKTRNELGRIATAFAMSANNIQSLNQTANGQAGQPIFSLDAPSAYAHLSNKGDAIIDVTVSDSAKLLADDYRIAYGASGWEITNNRTGTTTTSATLPAEVDGFKIDVASGAPQIGDRYKLEPARPGLTSLKMILTDSTKLALGSPVIASASVTNTSTASVAAVVASESPWDPNIKTPATIGYDGANFTVDGAAPAAVTKITEGWKITQNGWTVTLRGTPNAGDTFNVKPTSGIGDGRGAQQFADLGGAAIIAGNLTPSTAYSALVNDIGSKTTIAQATLKSAEVLQTQAINKKESVAGVNLDEEASNLLRWQQMYAAASKIISVSNTMFDSILSVF